jgi:hypothetical protein
MGWVVSVTPRPRFTPEETTADNTTLHFEIFFQMISQKYVLLNRFFTLIPEMTSIFIYHVRFLHKIGVYVLQLLLI